MKKQLFSLIITCFLGTFFLSCCSGRKNTPPLPPESESHLTAETSALSPALSESRDSTPKCLTAEALGTVVFENELASIDASNVSEGYIMVRYTGTCSKVKLQITGPDNITYTYNLIGHEYEAFPLSADSGDYTAAVYENIAGTSYAQILSEIIPAGITSEFGPYLYPNQYVDFTPSSKTVAKARELAGSADSDLEVVSNVYNYIITHIAYDYEKAENIQSGYTADLDQVLDTGRGICLDYAAVMTAMLRSQNIPTRLEVGYVQEIYHAWVSTYITEIGWVNGIVEFNGKDWELMDPTFAAASSELILRKFIGDGSHYTVKYMY